MKRENYDTVSEAISGLRNMGYTIDFSVLTEKECLICNLNETELSPDDFDIDDFFRFEGDSDPGDEMIVYAISSKSKKVKGIVVNAFGMYGDSTASDIVRKFAVHPVNKSPDIIDNIIHYFQGVNNKAEVEISPVGTCPICWGYQEYDQKIRTLLKDKQIDVNNHKDSYMLIQEFMKLHIDGITLEEGIVKDCPKCST